MPACRASVSDVLGVVYLCHAASGTAVAHGPALGSTAPGRGGRTGSGRARPASRRRYPRTWPMRSRASRIRSTGPKRRCSTLNNVEEDLSTLRINVEDIPADASQTAEALRPELALVRTQIEKLAATGQGWTGRISRDRRRAGASQRACLSTGRRHQVHRAHLGQGASVDRTHHGDAPCHFHQEPDGTPAEPIVARAMARPVQ